LEGKMKKLGLFAALPVAVLFAGAVWTTAALADDPILTKAPAMSAPPGPTSCDSVPAFFLSSFQLAWCGVRFYGVIDVGGGYQTNGAPFKPAVPARKFLRSPEDEPVPDVDTRAERIEPIGHRRSNQGAISSGLGTRR
jgi:hypothetical protein